MSNLDEVCENIGGPDSDPEVNGDQKKGPDKDGWFYAKKDGEKGSNYTKVDPENFKNPERTLIDNTGLSEKERKERIKKLE
jgi:hypothetical protein